MPQGAVFSEAKKYQRIREEFFIAGILLDLVVLLVFQVAGISAFFKIHAERMSDTYGFQVFWYLVFFFNAFFILLLPLRYYSEHSLEKRFRLSNETLTRWAVDELKKYFLRLVFFLVTGGGFLFLVRVFPGTWWFLAAAGYLSLTLLLTFLFPFVILPFFYKARMVPPGELKDRVLTLCRECGLSVMGVYEIEFSAKTKKANAAVIGIGKSRRILLTDTLLRNFPLPEIEMVVAHEIGHHVERHVARSFAFNAAAVLGGFYALSRISEALLRRLGTEGLWDLRIFPTLVFLSLLGGLLFLPAQNAFSRWMERVADEYALRKRPDKKTFVSLMRRLGERNLADLDPPFWVEFLLYDHPSIQNRIHRALSSSG